MMVLRYQHKEELGTSSFDTRWSKRLANFLTDAKVDKSTVIRIISPEHPVSRWIAAFAASPFSVDRTARIKGDAPKAAYLIAA